MLGWVSADGDYAIYTTNIPIAKGEPEPRWYIMNPYDDRSRSWNPLGIVSIDDAEEEYLAICELAEWLLASASTEPEIDEMGYWEYMANPMLRSLILHVRHLAKPRAADLSEVYRVACNKLDMIWKQMPLTDVYARGEMMMHLNHYLRQSPRERRLIDQAMINALKPWGERRVA